MAKIMIIGGHGKIALLAEPMLVADGHQVTAVIRNPEHTVDVEATGATARVADVESLDTASLTDLVAGQDAVVFAAGAGGGDPDRTYAVDRDAAIRTMDAAQAAGVGAYVLVSYLGASLDHGVPEDNSFFPYAEAKAAADEHLRNSELRWTILMPSRLTSEPSRGVDIDPAEGDAVSRAAVAEMVRGVLAPGAPDLAGVEIPFNDGKVGVPEALRGLTPQG